MNNHSSKKINELVEYYANNNINVLFNSQYISFFNFIDLSFRVIKKKIYSSIFSSSKSLESKVIEILESPEFKKSLKNNYAITLNEYIKYYDFIKEKNLRGFNGMK